MPCRLRATARPTRPPPMITHGGAVRVVVAGESLVVAVELFLGSGQHEDARLGQHGGRSGDEQLAAIPDAAHGEAGGVPDPGAEHLAEAQHLVATRELQDVDGGLGVRGGDDADRLGDLPYRERDVRVRGVGLAGSHDRCAGDARPVQAGSQCGFDRARAREDDVVSAASATRRGARARWVDSIHGRNTNWMKVKGNRTRMKTEPESSTTTENVRPRSDSKVMSPNPSVDIVTRVQYTAVIQL